MKIQSERVWLAGGFYPAQLTLENGVISDILTKTILRGFDAGRIVCRKKASPRFVPRP